MTDSMVCKEKIIFTETEYPLLLSGMPGATLALKRFSGKLAFNSGFAVFP